MDDDFLAELEKEEEVLKTSMEQPKTSYGDNKGKPSRGKSLWSNTDIKPKEIKSEWLKKPGDVYCICIPDNREEVPDDIRALFVKIVTSLSGKGYTLRFNGNDTNKLYQDILKIPGLKVETYLPWVKYNEQAPNIVTKFPMERAYQVACYLIKDFNKKPDAVRAILANVVETTLGKDCSSPVKFMVGYSSCGIEGFSKDVQIDYSSVKNLTDYIRIAHKFALPFFNIGKQDNVKRLSDYIKNLTSKGEEHGK